MLVFVSLNYYIYMDVYTDNNVQSDIIRNKHSLTISYQNHQSLPFSKDNVKAVGKGN